MDKPSMRAFLGERRFRLELRRKGLLVRSFSNSYFPISFVPKASILQVPDLGGSISVVVIASVVVGDRCVHQFIYIHVVQARDANGVELSAEIRRFSPCERTNTTARAKHVMVSVRLIVNELGLTRQQPEAIRFHDDCPQPCLGAHLAVALEGARAQINVRFKTYSSTMSAS